VRGDVSTLVQGSAGRLSRINGSRAAFYSLEGVARLVPWEANTMKRKALAVQPILATPENRAKGCQVPGPSPSSHARYRALYVATVFLLIVVAGCGSGGGGTLTGPGAGPSIYLTQDNLTFGGTLPSNILQFSTTANGTVSPTATLTGPDNVVFTGLAVDGTGNAYVGGEIFGTGGGSGGPPLASVEILVYAPGADGTHPTRTITSRSLQINQGGINALTVDSSGNLYVSAVLAAPNLGSGVAIFSPTANGDSVPIRVIGGNATTIVGLGAIPIAVDSADNIYISTADLGSDSILIFNSSANGNVPPTSTIGGPATTINGIEGLALDSAGNIYVSNIPSDNPNEEILEFSAGSTGNVAPIRTISGPATTMSAVGNLALDSAGNIYVLNSLSLLKFAPNATGNVAPIATITTSTSLIFDISIAVH
jgi:hypothetical protein